VLIAHGGTISVQPNEPGGSRLSLRVPAA
jgi:signal transduction histidine kinase